MIDRPIVVGVIMSAFAFHRTRLITTLDIFLTRHLPSRYKYAGHSFISESALLHLLFLTEGRSIDHCLQSVNHCANGRSQDVRQNFVRTEFPILKRGRFYGEIVVEPSVRVENFDLNLKCLGLE